VNINPQKKQIFIFAGLFFILAAGVAYLSSHKTTDQQRKLASMIDQANPNWTPGQKLKWAVTKQFSIQIFPQEVLMSTPLAVELCAGNFGLGIKLTANEIMNAGQNPQVKISIACPDLIGKLDYKFAIPLKTVVQLHKVKELKADDLQFQAFNVYGDDEWPSEWTLTEIEVIGPKGFIINQFEIQEAQQSIFTVSIPKNL
jgi:hypothetical protein